jgi:protein SCO1/2
MRLFVILTAIVLLFVQCGTGGEQTDNGAFVAGSNAKRYELKGKVVSFNKDKKEASIAHDEIPGYMSAMTMDFPIKEDWVWGVLTEGSEIQADLVVDNESGKFWLENPRIVASTVSEKAPPIREDVAVVGKEIIDFSLTDQDGKPISPKDFEGKAWAITFIYTDCPLPNYCILMSKNFSDLANKIAENADLKDKIKLLSISFDPAKDTPAKLKQYGLGYLGKDSKAADFSVWKLAVGDDEKIRKIADFFGLRYEVDSQDKTQFNHSLRTVVVGPDGTVRKVFTGNDWKTDGLFSELQKALE